MSARNVRLHHKDGKVHVEPLVTFAKANGTDLKGARAMLEFWQQRGWITRRPDGGYDVKRRVGRRDPETLGHIRKLGHPVPGFIPAPKAVKGCRPERVILDEAADFQVTWPDA